MSHIGVTSTLNYVDDLNTANTTLHQEEVILPKLTYSSYVELTVAIIYLVATTVWICVAHGIIIHCVWRHPSLHLPTYYVIATYSVCDIAINVFSNVLSLGSLIYAAPVPQWACQALSCPAIVAFFSIVYVVAVMAYERYRYFVHPLSYPIVFSPRNTAIILGVTIGVCTIYSIITEITIGRVYHESILICHLPGTIYLNYAQIACFFGPSMLISLYGMIRIWHLALVQRVAPTSDANTSGVSHGDKIRVGLKAIVLVSGTFWGTYIPGFILRTALFSSGYTWYDMDTRRTMGAAIGIRIANLMLIQVSSAVNPFIYYSTNKRLKGAICKTLGWTFNEQNMDVTQNSS